MIEIKIIAAMLNDVATSHGVEFNSSACRLTIEKVKKRVDKEGISFLTKTLPRLGRALDRALTEEYPLNAVSTGFKPMQNSKLPRFLGELFSRVFNPDGTILPIPCVSSVSIIRNILYCFSKYKLPYNDEQEQSVVSKFKRTEDDLSSVSDQLRNDSVKLDTEPYTIAHRRRHKNNWPFPKEQVIREARILLSNVFAFFDPTDISPKHGPGAVATKQKLSDKYRWSNICRRITEVYPLDAYFFASAGSVCDNYDTFTRIGDEDLAARVVLVPKDSRGPRLISCEPVDFQFIQQGLMQAIVDCVEHNELTQFNVFFTDQRPNQIGALLGSCAGRYSTLDLNEASDRISVELVRLLFPVHLVKYLEACRSLSTVLPNGEVLTLKKFAPMGSGLCFPILALSIWAILTASAPDTYTRERILVYGDDVIVPTANAANAIEQLESFGLKVNRDKSCTGGLFRESCGTDAFRGADVTPVRFRTVWSSVPSPDVYTSYIAYANGLWDRCYYGTYDLVVRELHDIYGAIPEKGQCSTDHALPYVDDKMRKCVRRWNKDYQVFQYRIWDTKSPTVIQHLPGWSALLRYFCEVGNKRNRAMARRKKLCIRQHCGITYEVNLNLETDYQLAFSVSSYTRTRTSKLVRVWR